MLLAPGLFAQSSDLAFLPASISGIDAGPRRSVTADFDLDGHIDLAVTCSIGGTDDLVKVLLGGGKGTFVDSKATKNIQWPWGIDVGDVDEDGYPDLAVTEGTQIGTGIGVPILLGLGDGTMVVHHEETAGTFPIALVLRDFDGDGHIDMAVANNVHMGCQVFRGHGDATFDPPSSVLGLGNPHGTDLFGADLDGDGDVDLLLSHYSGAFSLRNAQGVFALHAQAAGSSLTEAIDGGDLDLDGDIDAVSVETYSGRIVVRRNLGDATFWPSPTSTRTDVRTSRPSTATPPRTDRRRCCSTPRRRRPGPYSPLTRRACTHIPGCGPSEVPFPDRR